MENNISIRFNPEQALLDEVIEVSVTGLTPKLVYTLMCRVQEADVRWFSWAYYTSSDDGRIAVSEMEALPGGSYEGVEPMGYVWSLKQEPGQKPGRRLLKRVVTTPIVTNIYVLDGRLDPDNALRQIDEGRWLAHSSCNRLHVADGVQRIAVREDRIVGTMFIPAGPGPHPGVIDLYGAVGGIQEPRSAMLASRGIASLVLGYMTAKDGKTFSDIEYFEEAIDYLVSHPKVRKPFVGIIGSSKGGEFALLVGALCHKVRACVGMNCLDVLTQLDITYKGKRFTSLPLPFGYMVREEHGLNLREACKQFVGKEYEIGAIPVELGQCQYLLINGGDDKGVPPFITERIPARLRKHNKDNYQTLLYPGAGHLIETPYSPHFYATYNDVFGDCVIWGGSPKLHAMAQEDAWRRILEFFKTNLDENVQNTQAKL